MTFMANMTSPAESKENNLVYHLKTVFEWLFSLPAPTLATTANTLDAQCHRCAIEGESSGL
jgi:hypothetical protein